MKAQYPYQTPEQIPKPQPNAALDAMMSGRSEIAETRLAVTAVQIVERLKIRSSHLNALLEEELDVDTQLIQLRSRPALSSEMMGLESMLRQKQFQIKSDRRREDNECWRDLTHVMRDLLNAWEGFSRNEAKNRFLNTLPAKQAPEAHRTYTPMPAHYQNDQLNTPENKRNEHGREGGTKEPTGLSRRQIAIS